MKLLPCFLLLAAMPLFPASFSASVGFPSAPQSPGCTMRRADGLTASCSAALNGSQGTSLVNGYSPETGVYKVLGAVHVTQPAGGPVSVTASLVATLDEFADLTEGGVRLTHNCVSNDCEPVMVSVNGAEVGTLQGGDSLLVAYAGQPLSITLYAHEQSAGEKDYVGLVDITASAYTANSPARAHRHRR